MNSRIQKMIDYAIGIALDQSHGYDQRFRWGEYGDYDCSSLIYTAAENAGYAINRQDPRYTGTMIRDFANLGFEIIPFKSLDQVQAGDILLNVSTHTALSIGNNQLVEASINEFGGIVGGKPGDQADEIHITRLYNFPWNYILRDNTKEEEIPEMITNDDIQRIAEAAAAAVWTKDIYNVAAQDRIFGMDAIQLPAMPENIWSYPIKDIQARDRLYGMDAIQLPAMAATLQAIREFDGTNSEEISRKVQTYIKDLLDNFYNK